MTTRKSRSKGSAKKTIFILDDHPMMREGLAQLINHEADLAVCGDAGTARDLEGAIARLKPDLLLADISLPEKNGLEVIKDMQALYPELPVLIISMHDESLYAERVLRAGGRGYIMKQEGGKKLMEAIRQVLSGKIYVSDQISGKILESLSHRNEAASGRPMENLTDREFEVLQLLGLGKGTSEIAQQLHLSNKTVEAHRANIKRKLNIKTGPELVRYAVRWVESAR